MNTPLVIDCESLEFVLLCLAVLGMLLGLFSSYFKMRSYRNILQQIGDNGGGFEKINGKWYRITEVSESDKEIIEDMGIPMNMKRL